MDKFLLLTKAVVISAFLFSSSFSLASGKQFRPPKSDPCKVSPDSEKCKAEKKDEEKK